LVRYELRYRVPRLHRADTGCLEKEEFGSKDELDVRLAEMHAFNAWGFPAYLDIETIEIETAAPRDEAQLILIEEINAN
jgi:hypothetical protein